MQNEFKKRGLWIYTRPDGLIVEEKKVESINESTKESFVLSHANIYL